MITSPNWEIEFFDERVESQIKGWPADIYADFLRLAGLIQDYGADLRLPHSRAMGKGLFELRCKGREGIGRAFYCMRLGRRIVILHGFIKKTQETPDKELRIARKRQRDVLDDR